MKISRDHNLGLDEARSRVTRVAGKLQKKFSLSSEWSEDNLVFKGSGVTGQIAVADSKIDLDVSLGLTLMMLEGSIKSAINEALDEEFA